MRPRALIVAVLVLVSMPVVQARRAVREAPVRPEFALRSEGVITLPFRLSNNHLVFTIEVNGKPLEVVLDTGMPMDGLLLFDNARVGEVGLEFRPGLAQIGGAGGEGRMDARVATAATVDVGAARMNNMAVIMPPPLDHFDGYVDGIIGASLFFRFVVHIDYDRKRLELHEPDGFEPPEGAALLPLDLRTRMPFAKVAITTAGGKAVSFDVVVDLGASHAISLNVRDAGNVRVPAETLTTVIGRGLNGAIEGRVGRISRLELAGFVLDDVLATFPRSEHQRPAGMDSRDGNLGSGILKRFNFSIDYPGKRILLTPNEGFDEPFEWDMSGMRVTPHGDTMRVDAVLDESPAARAGVAIDDVVTHVDGEPISPRDSEAVRRLMRRDGAKVAVTLEHDGQVRTVNLVLRRLV